MTVFRNEGRWDTSNVLFDGVRVVRYDKRAPTPDMRYIDYGLGLLTGGVLTSRNADEPFDLVGRLWGAGGRWPACRLRGDPALLRDRHARWGCRDRSIS